MARFVVRYGATRQLGVMSARGNDEYRRGVQVVARTNRGLEVGEVLCPATEEVIEKMQEPSGGQILRMMEDDDFNELGRIGSTRQQCFEICQKHIDALKLEMQLVEIEQIFGGERIVVYYLAEQRVDFRELVKVLASEFQTRIEMRQIGVRDEAKLLADYGDCGKPVCCNTHLSAMPPVSMKMAKIQKATLDPNKISGRCGRLKCCLRYEYDTYNELQKTLPPVGSDIVTRDGRGRVLSQELLAEQLLIETEDHRRKMIDASEVLSVIARGKQKSSRRSTGGAPKKNPPKS